MSPTRPPRFIDDEIRRIVEEGEHTARAILTSHLDELHALAQGAARIRDALVGRNPPPHQG